ncbi:MAG: methylmalonyl-CoA mutase family protein [Polyangiaceae bacterium]
MALKPAHSSVLADLVTDGIRIEPLYTETPKIPLDREISSGPFRICTRAPNATEASADLSGGAEALWTSPGAALALDPKHLASTFFIFDGGLETFDVIAELASKSEDGNFAFALNFDPVNTGADLRTYAERAHAFAERFPNGCATTISTLPYHDAGADMADEIAITLASGVAILDSFVEAGLSPNDGASQISLQIAIGRDTFLELAKIRALRVCWKKFLAASGAAAHVKTAVHAVCSSRTMTVRDPWVNMLRVTTQLFAGILGGADFVTPNAFDQAFGVTSDLGRRMARNTGLVLRDESFLGKVKDPAGGSYYLETVTDALAREAWRRFQKIEEEGGVVALLHGGALMAQLNEKWRVRLTQIAKRKVAILGVSEFANLDEKLPHPAPHALENLVAHRDSEAFELLRERADRLKSPPEAILVALGALAESRPRVGFSSGFLAAGGIRSREVAAVDIAPLAIVCGTDERYATEAVEKVRALKSVGCKIVLLAGRPGALEADLKTAGADGFIFVGCDVVSTVNDLLSAFERGAT